jgi:hypothetical protein
MHFNFSRETKIFVVLIACFLVAGSIAFTQHTTLTTFERDGTEFLFDAKRILNGEGYDSDFWPFGYMILVAALGFVSSTDLFISAKLITFFSAVGVIILTYIISKKVFSEKVSLLAILILITNHLFFVHSLLIETDMLFVFFFLFSIYFLLKSDSIRDHLSAGCTAGLAYMVKFAIYAIFPVMVFLFGLKFINGKMFDSAKRLTLFILAFFVTCSPWLINNTIKNGSPFYNKHYVNIAWGMNRPQPMPNTYWQEYFKLNEKYASAMDVFAETKKFLLNWGRNIIRLPENILRILPFIGFFLIPGYFLLFSRLDRRLLIMVLITFSFIFQVTVAYTWDRYLLPLLPFFSMIIAYALFEIIPNKFDIKTLLTRYSAAVPFRAIIVAFLILLSLGKSAKMVASLMDEQIPEFKVAGEWLKDKLEEDDWLMVPEPQFAWYAGTDKFVKYATDRTLPLEQAVKMREQSTFFFIQEGLSKKIITDIKYYIYDKRWWIALYPSLMSDSSPNLPPNFIKIFSSIGPKTEISVYKVTRNQGESHLRIGGGNARK